MPATRPPKAYKVISKNSAQDTGVARLGVYWSASVTEAEWLADFFRMNPDVEEEAYWAELHEDGATIHHNHLARTTVFKEASPVKNVIQQAAQGTALYMAHAETLRLQSILDTVLAATGTSVEVRPGISPDEQHIYIKLNDKAVLPKINVDFEWVSEGSGDREGFGCRWAADIRRIERQDDGSITVVVSEPERPEDLADGPRS